MTIGWISTFNTKCGIATYSQHMLQSLHLDQIKIFAEYTDQTVTSDSENVIRCWHRYIDNLYALYTEVLKHNVTTIVIQYHPGLFNNQAIDWFINTVKLYNIRVVFMIHSMPKHVPYNIARCEHVTVQIQQHYDLLEQWYTANNLTNNVSVHPHGIHVTSTIIQPRVRTWPLIGCFGFSLPNKGILQLLQALVVLNRNNFPCSLLLLNAEYPAPVSAEYINQCRQFISDNNLENQVQYITDFLSDQDINDQLSQCDFLVHPYQNTAEPVSGSVRHLLSLGLPVAITSSDIFNDIRELTYQIQGTSSEDIASAIPKIANSIQSQDQEFTNINRRAKAWIENNSYSTLSSRILAMLNKS